MIRIDVTSDHDGVFEVAGEESGAILDLDPQGSPRPVSRIRYSLEARLLGTEILVSGRLEVDVEHTCVRCLEPFVETVLLDAWKTSVEARNEGGLDLTARVREDILLALPPYPHCDASGSRVCPAVKRFVKGGKSETDPSNGPTSGGVWDVLDSLQEGDEE